MGRKSSIEVRYTTNKRILSEALTREMCNSFEHSEEFPEQGDVDPMPEQRQEIQGIIEQTTAR